MRFPLHGGHQDDNFTNFKEITVHEIPPTWWS